MLLTKDKTQVRKDHILTINRDGAWGHITLYIAISFSDIFRSLWKGALTGPQNDRYLLLLNSGYLLIESTNPVLFFFSNSKSI